VADVDPFRKAVARHGPGRQGVFRPCCERMMASSVLSALCRMLGERGWHLSVAAQRLMRRRGPFAAGRFGSLSERGMSRSADGALRSYASSMPWMAVSWTGSFVRA